MSIIHELFTIPYLPVGARLYAHEQIHARAQVLSLASLVAHTERAIAHDRQSQQLELRLAAAYDYRYGPELIELDNVVDRTLSGFDGYFEVQVRIYGPDSERGRAALVILYWFSENATRC